MRLIVNIDVPDLAAACAFYEAALGLRTLRVLDDDVAELAGASSMLCLLRKPPASQAAATVPAGRDFGQRHWTPVHLDFVVADLAAASARVLAAGAKQESGIVAWRGSRCITFGDPFGHGFCLIEFEGDGYR